jgi:integrase
MTPPIGCCSDWSAPILHQTFLQGDVPGRRVTRQPPRRRSSGVVARLKFHAPRHTYASLCVAAGIPVQVSRFMGHAKVITTLSIHTHLFDDDHVEPMAALEAMSRPVDAPHVVPIWKRR